jgi:hypothetical protein
MIRYTLITKLGKVMVFRVKALAENYQLIYGGTVIDALVLQSEMTEVEQIGQVSA